MTKGSTQHILRELFIELSGWREDCKIHYSTVGSLDRLAHISLRITALLVDDARLMKMISSRLLIIIDAPESKAVSSELEQSFLDADLGLEESLRGFSSLFDWVLEDSVIRQDPEAMLNQIENMDDNVSKIFQQLSSALITYLDLEEAFLVEFPRIPVVLFLISLQELCDEMTNRQCGDGKHLIEEWLRERVKDRSLAEFFFATLKQQKLDHISEEALRDVSLLLVRICMMVSRGSPLDKREAAIIDSMLNHHDLVGIMPLIESGFLTIEDPDSDAHGKFAARILRVK